MEEAFGLAGWLQWVIPIPVCIRLHGPWFLNGAALGVPEDNAFRRRVALEGWAIRHASAVTAPSLDVLERTRTYYGLALEGAQVIPNPTQPVDPAGTLAIGRVRSQAGPLHWAIRPSQRRRPDCRRVWQSPSRGARRAARFRGTGPWSRIRRRPALGRGGVISTIDCLGLGGQAASTCWERSPIQSSMTFGAKRWSRSPARATRSSALSVAESMAFGCPIVAARRGDPGNHPRRHRRDVA